VRAEAIATRRFSVPQVPAVRSSRAAGPEFIPAAHGASQCCCARDRRMRIARSRSPPEQTGQGIWTTPAAVDAAGLGRWTWTMPTGLARAQTGH
jgi:hypothetical protein